MGFLATSRGLTNEVYYVQKAARVSAPTTWTLLALSCSQCFGLKATLGRSADGSFVGFHRHSAAGCLRPDLANNQPVTTKYMTTLWQRHAHRRSTRYGVWAGALQVPRRYQLLFGTKLG
jgi:hypothetical protein